MHPALIVLLIVLDLPFFYWFAMVAFRDWNAFTAAIVFWFKPALRAGTGGGHHQDVWAEVKLVALGLAYTLIVLFQLALLRPLLG